jgi:hypothetical protein
VAIQLCGPQATLRAALGLVTTNDSGLIRCRETSPSNQLRPSSLEILTRVQWVPGRGCDAWHLCRTCISSKQQFPDFAFDRWEATDGKRFAVLTYTVDAAHSGYWLCCPCFTAAHRGFVCADPQRGAVRRIITYAVFPSPRFRRTFCPCRPRLPSEGLSAMAAPFLVDVCGSTGGKLGVPSCPKNRKFGQG